MPIVYKYRPGRGPISIDSNDKEVEIFERDLQLLANDRIYVPTAKQLNDPTEAIVDDSRLNTGIDFIKQLMRDKSTVFGVEDAYTNFKQHIKTVGIYSLSKNPTNELMWAYYANGHNGYAIIFDTDVLCRSFNSDTRFPNLYAFDVKYVESVPSIDINLFSEINDNKFIEKFIGSKSSSWKHEQEHRLIFEKGGEIKHIDYRAIKGFVFGYLFPKEDIEYIMNLFKGRHLSYYQIKLNPKEYQFYEEGIEDVYKDAPSYHPNNVTYDFEALIEEAKFYDDIILSYKKEAQKALEMVVCEPFVTGIYLLAMYGDETTPGSYQITIGADYHNPSVLQPKKVFRFEVRNDKRIVRID